METTETQRTLSCRRARWQFFALRSLCLCGLLFGFTSLADPDAATDAKPKYQFPKPQKIKGVENFGKVSETLYRGAQPTAEGFKELKKMGIKTIVDPSFFTWSRDDVHGHGFRYVHVTPFQPNDPKVEPLIEFLKLMEDRENHPVFVHCLTGGDRTGAYVAIYRMHVQKWPKGKAIAEMNVYGFRKDWWKDTIYFLNDLNLDAFAKKLKDARKPEVKVVP